MALTNWRRHVHRVGRNLGVPAAARVPLAAVLASLAAVGIYLRRNQLKAGDAAVFVFPGNPSGGQPAMRLNVRVVKDASLLAGSFGVDGGVTIAPADVVSQAGFNILFPGTTPGTNATTAIVSASALEGRVPSLRLFGGGGSGPPSVSGRAPLTPGPLNITIPPVSRRITNMVLP